MAALLVRLAVGRRVATALLVTAFFATAAHAGEDGPLELHWHAPDNCPEKEVVVQAIGEHLTESPLRSSREQVTAHVKVQPQDDRWRAHLSLHGAVTGERVFQAASCEELTEMVSLVIAMALQAEHAPSAAVERSSPELAGTEPPAEREPTPPRDERAFGQEPNPPAPSNDARFALGVAGLVDSAALPRVAAGVAAQGLLDVGPIQASITAGYFPPASTSVPGHATAETQFELALGRLQGCYVPWTAPPRAAVCAALEGGVLKGRSEGLDQPETAATPWAAAGTGIVAGFLIGNFRLRAEADLIWPLTRPRFVVDQQNETHAVPRIGVRAGFGILVPL